MAVNTLPIARQVEIAMGGIDKGLEAIEPTRYAGEKALLQLVASSLAMRLDQTGEAVPKEALVPLWCREIDRIRRQAELTQTQTIWVVLATVGAMLAVTTGEGCEDDNWHLDEETPDGQRL